MGGSGGGYFQSSPDEILRKLRESESATAGEQFDASVAACLSGLLSEFNDRDAAGIQRHLDEIRAALENELAGTVDINFGGSVAKRTYVEGLSDVDSLVMLDSCELADGSPSAARAYFAARLRDRFPNTEVKEGELAVTVSFTDAQVQLLPAVSCRGAVKIADPDTDQWSKIKPRAFTELLSSVNANSGFKVVPVVKLAKAIVSHLPEQQRISGYHAESLAVDIFRDYSGPLRPKDMLKHFFAEATGRVLAPVTDRTGQSVHVDEYLGPAGSLRRRVVSDAFGRVTRRMNNADVAGSVESWQKLFDESQ
jgi:hypothetical protein